LQAWQEQRPPGPSLGRSPIERPVAALRRYKWLMLAVVVIAAAGGVAATRFVAPQFEVRASVMLTTDNGAAQRDGPIRSPGLLNPDDWGQLLRSFTISDAVVRQLRLYVHPNSSDDAELFNTFVLGDGGTVGGYELVIHKSTHRWTLVSSGTGTAADSGAAADSVGRRVGFQWTLPAWAFNGVGDRKVKFTVATPRETAVQIISRLNTSRQKESNFLNISLQDSDPKLAANIVNTWLREFVSVAASLKRRKLIDFSHTLEGQLATAKASLDSAEVNLAHFRVTTITQPSEGVAIASGLTETRDPVMADFFQRKISYEDVKHDIRQLQDLLSSIQHDSVPDEALLDIRNVASQASGTGLRAAIADYRATEATLAVQRQQLQEEHPTIKALVAKANTLKKVTIPQYANDILTTLRLRQQDDSARIVAQEGNLQKIPERTIEEERLRGLRDAAAALHTSLQNRFAEAQLSQASATPDISVLDTAIAPLAPTKNTAPRIILFALAGGIGLAVALAIALDRFDSKLRYPEQATDELGLPISGAIPRFPKGGLDANSPEETFQLVESFRSLRLNVAQVAANGRLSVAISSPSPAEGKSLIAANLAISFADSGLRTVLIDGDTRRGALHEMFGLVASPGLTDYLAGTATLTDVSLATSQPSLTLIPCGVRRRRSPELLTSPRLGQLIDELRANYDVVIFDTPPLAAGIDGYAIASATGNLLVVLRIGSTARRLAAEKIRLFERLPVSIVGGVLNGIQASEGYGYYGYVPGYEAREEEEESTEVASST
ncbi:MAG: polysaccharide biosynthesis tyrosine autokinase, partial [Gemmatimonadaceae bacterium]